MRNEELIVSHINYAQRIAVKILQRQQLHFEEADLESEALYGLVMAGQRFEAQRGVPFHVFVRVRIAGQVQQWLTRTPAFHSLLDVHQVDAELESIAQGARLRRLLRFLPTRWRGLLVMHFWFGFSHREIARRMGVTECRVWQMQGKALCRLREIMEGVYDPLHRESRYRKTKRAVLPERSSQASRHAES